MSKRIIVAIDGYSSCGKSTLAKALAKELGYTYIDSGAMYRAVALYMLNRNLQVEDLQKMNEAEMQAFLNEVQISFQLNPDTKVSEIHLNGRNIEKEIRDMKISDIVSPVSAIASVRKKMIEIQRAYGREKGIVMDGRDIGTTVFPHADLKLFMTAKMEVRAKRRFDELKSKGAVVTMDEVYKNIESRDNQDTSRKESPLRQAEDAIVLDNSELNEKEQFAIALNYVKEVQKK